MVCLRLEPTVAVRKAQTNPLSHGGTPIPSTFVFVYHVQVRDIHGKEISLCLIGPTSQLLTNISAKRELYCIETFFKNRL